jgi:hypothetical protein
MWFVVIQKFPYFFYMLTHIMCHGLAAAYVLLSGRSNA